MIAALHPAQLLDASDRGGSLHPIDRALLVLSLAGFGNLSSLPIAERDRRLIELRRIMFGEILACTAQCPECGETLEFELTSSGLLDGLRSPSPPETVTVSGWELALRSLDSHDLAAAARTGNREAAAAVLISLGFDVTRKPDGADEMPEAVLLRVGEIVGAREAAADIALDLICAACRKSWIEGFDIGAYLWVEIDMAARRLIGEVAALAERFGWSEADILAMPPARRRSYLSATGFA